MDKTTKIKRITFFVLKIILLIVVLGLMYFQLQKSDFSLQKIELQHYSTLFLAVLLLPLNWYIEFLKWKSILKSQGVARDNDKEKNSFYAGIVTGMLTPNMLGNFLGRIYYFEKKHRIGIILLTLMSNYAQFLITILYGILAFFLFQGKSLQVNETGFLLLPGLGLLLLLCYFYYDKFFLLFSIFKSKTVKRILALKKDTNMLTALLVLSMLRYFVFTAQFTLILHAFGAEISFNVIFLIMQYYFILIFFPSLFLGKFIIRDSVAMMVLGGIVASNEIVLVASLSVWVINLLVPTIFALVILKNKK
ncbi:MAG: lysylphosphatidylglycerol synthase domain-containing protein [Bacteroidota bacterium]